MGVSKQGFVGLWELGLGGMRIRTREMQSITSYDDGLDVHSGLIVGYQVAHRETFRLVPFVGLGTDFLVPVEDTHAGRRLTLGLEAEAILRQDKTSLGVSARLAYGHFGTGVVYDDASMTSQELDISALMLQFGFWLSVDPTRDN